MIDAERRERVHHGVGDRRRGAVGAAFADAFDAQRIKGIRRNRLAENHRRHVGGAHDRIIHQRAGLHLAVFAVEHLFALRFAETLSDAAVNLAFDDHRVDDYAAVVDEHQLFDGQFAGVAIDADGCDVGAEAPGFALGIVESGFLQADFHALAELGRRKRRRRFAAR